MNIGFLDIVFIILMVLKLTGLATISWLVVFSPFILYALLCVIIFLLAFFSVS